MKLESLASVLGTDAKELATTLNVAENQSELDDTQVVSLLKEKFKEIEINNLSEGKKQGEGMARRLVLKEVEDTLKKSFEIDGSNFEDIVGKLKTTIKSPKTDPNYEAKIEAYKTKNVELENQLKTLQESISATETKQTVMSKISSLLNEFEFATDKVKTIAVREFVDKNKFLISGDDVFIELDGKPSMKLMEIAESTLSEFGSKKVAGKPAAPNYKPNDFADLNSLDTKDLLKKVREAKTPEERATLLEQLKKM